jgi:glycosyltransferase involved in cell wall biosynthesis
MSPSTFLLTVPYYAGVEHLTELLATVVGQTDPDWQCVVVDDSPVEHGVDRVVAALGEPRVTYRRNERNLGVAGAFNRCFEIAVELGAELVSIVHADDLLEADYVAVARAAHTTNRDAVGVAPHVTVIGADGRPRRSVPDTVKAALWPRRLDRLVGEQGLRTLLRGQFFYCPSVSYRLALVELPAWNDRWGQVMDLELYCRILLTDGVIALESRSTYRYRRHDASATQVNSSTLLRTVEETALCREVIAAARQRGWPSAARAGRSRWSVRLQGLMQAGRLLFGGQLVTARDAVVLSLRP